MVGKMVGRNDRVIVDALELVAPALHGQQNQTGDELCGLGNFKGIISQHSRAGMIRRVLRCGSKRSRKFSM